MARKSTLGASFRAGRLPTCGSSLYAGTGLAKLQLCELLRGRCSPRLLYLDSDVMVCDKLTELERIDLQGCPIAAVQDYGMPCGHEGLATYGWDVGCEPYFNAGVMVIDVEAASAVFADAAARAVSRKEGSGLRYAGQDVLNLAFHTHGGWRRLNHRWNVQGLGSYAQFRCQPDPKKPALFTERELDILQSSPGIMHFTGPPTPQPWQVLNLYVPHECKPWSCMCTHPHAAAFHAALAETPWAHSLPLPHQELVQPAVRDVIEFGRRAQQQAGDSLDMQLYLRGVALALQAEADALTKGNNDDGCG